MSTTSSYRYPGSRPFQDTKIDRLLYFGREHEKESLFQMILAERLVVLYSKSGMGKTSLLNAGVNELLREREFFPIVIRLNNPEGDLFQDVYDSVKQSTKGIERELEQKKTLWEFFKSLELWNNDDILLTPVLIFDQFEELFTLHSPATRKTFITQFADLVKNRIPDELLESMKSGNKPLYTETPPNIRVVISIREDWLGHLEELSRGIPDIFRNLFRVLPLNREQARKAVVNPALLKKDDTITAKPFEYADDTVAAMLDFLCRRKKIRTDAIITSTGKLSNCFNNPLFLLFEKAGDKLSSIISFDSSEVEPFQLQLLCQHIENRIVGDSAENVGEHIVYLRELGGESGMKGVLQNFYDDQIKLLDSRHERRNVIKLCEKGLISVTDRRLSLEKEEIERKYNVPKNILAELVNSRLLRSEPRVGSTYYELSHDTLIEPILESRKKRKKKKDSSISKLSLVTLMLCLVPALTFLMHKDSERVRAEDAIKNYKKTIESGSENSPDFCKLGDAFYAKKKYKEAVDQYRKAIEQYKKFVETAPYYAYSKLGDVFYAQKEYGKAMAQYGKAIEISPYYYTDPYNNLGKASNKQIRPKRESITIGHNASTYSLLGNTFMKLKNYEEAINQYRKAIEIDPDNTYANTMLGLAFYKQKNYEEAINQYRKAIEIDPDNTYAYNKLGRVFEKQKNYEEAINQYRKAIEIDPDNTYAY
ncbi:tetratricopeptide repeat protein, partial [Desulfobacterales bacterium HSG16]|nr:tetratricopeptide repeat protein [Desulfobacterales bacterium HSG16]